MIAVPKEVKAVDVPPVRGLRSGATWGMRDIQGCIIRVEGEGGKASL